MMTGHNESCHPPLERVREASEATLRVPLGPQLGDRRSVRKHPAISSGSPLSKHGRAKLGFELVPTKTAQFPPYRLECRWWM